MITEFIIVILWKMKFWKKYDRFLFISWSHNGSFAIGFFWHKLALFWHKFLEGPKYLLLTKFQKISDFSKNFKNQKIFRNFQNFFLKLNTHLTWLSLQGDFASGLASQSLKLRKAIFFLRFAQEKNKPKILTCFA